MPVVPKALGLLGTTYERFCWRPNMALEERLRAEFMVEPRPTLWTAMACDMIGQRSATIRRFDMAPPLAETEVDVERARRVLGDVFLRKGQSLAECFRAGSMMAKADDRWC